jgi:hypothetical protein
MIRISRILNTHSDPKPSKEEEHKDWLTGEQVGSVSYRLYRDKGEINKDVAFSGPKPFSIYK